MNTPPPPGYANYPRAFSPHVRFEVISEAFSYFGRNPSVWIVAALPITAINVVHFIVSLASGQFQNSTNLGVAFGSLGISTLLSLAFTIVQFVLLGGLVNMAVRQIRGEPIQASDALKIPNLGNIIAAGLLTTIAETIGSCFCLIPGLILSGLFFITYPLITDQGAGAIDAMSRSVKILQPDMWLALVVAFVSGLIVVVGLLTCVGSVVAFPVFALCIAGVYADFFIRPQQLAAVPVQPQSPVQP